MVMVSDAKDGPGWTGKARSAAARYRNRRSDLEPLIRLAADALALAAVLRQLSRDSKPSHFGEEETS